MTNGTTELLTTLIDQLSRLPGIGKRSAERIAFHLLRAPKNESLTLAQAVRDVVDKVRHCSRCFNLTDEDPCHICSDSQRDQGVICVVEQPSDIASIESTGSYNGLYHVLLGHIAPLDGIEPGHLTIDALVERIRSGQVKEVVMATNPTMEGDGTALHVQSRLAGMDVRVTRLARGLSVGSQLEYASRQTLSDAFRERRAL